MAATDLDLTDAHFRLLVEAVQDYAIYFIDPNGIVRSWNKGARRLKGYTDREIIGRSFSVFYTPEDVARHKPERMLSLALERGSLVDVGWRVRKDGSRFWARVVITALRDANDRHVGFTKVTRDLTDEGYREFVEAAHAIVWTTDAAGRPNADSSSWRAFTGQSEEAWRGQHGWDPVHPDDLHEVAKAWATATAEGSPFEAEFRLRRHDGVYAWMATRAVPLKHEDGQVREWFGVTFDISARKKAEEEREASLNWWTTTVSSIGDAVVATDAAGSVRFMNAAAERVTGVSAAVAVGRPVEDVFTLVDAHTRAPVVNPARRVLEDDEPMLADDAMLLRPGGGEVAVQSNAAAIRVGEGRLDGAVLVFRDVTRERAAQERLAFLARVGEVLMATDSSQDALQAFAQLAVPRLADWCTVHVVDAAGVLRPVAVGHANPSLVALARRLAERYPAPADAPRGAPHVVRTGEVELYPEVPAQLVEEAALAEEDRDVVRDLHLRSAVIVPLKGREGIFGALTLIYAESGRHYSQEDVSFAEVLARRASLVIERRRLEEAAQAANRTKDEFLATISHELRTPLQAVLGWATILARGKARDPQKAVGAIVRNAWAQARLIDDIFDVSGIISGKLRMHMARIEVATVVRAALDAVRPAAAARGVRVTEQIDPAVGEMLGDPDRLQQVVWNLVNNAVKFTDAGGEVIVRATREDALVRIAVKDTGRGIKPEDLRVIFERFRQVDSSPTRTSGGLGLGLAIVRYLVEAHGGIVEADSPGPGQGSTFTVVLPATPPAVAPGAAPPARAPWDMPLAHVRVLVVDDDEDSREIIGDVLADAGADVVRASSASTAFASLLQGPPQVLVSDIGMPGEDGYGLIARIRALPPEKGRDVPAVALTAYARGGDKRRAEEAGFQVHLKKPVEPTALVDAVRELCGAREPASS